MRLAGIVLGLGLGGFVDGITLHQIMQWHNMGSAVLPPTTMAAMAQNMTWDGMFHGVTLVLTIIGVLMLWSDGVAGYSPRSMSVFVGEMILGWGLFNLVEGVVDHHLLNIHPVRDLPFHVPAYVMGLNDGFSPKLGDEAVAGAGNLVGLTNQVTVADIDASKPGLEMLFAGYDGKIHAVAANKQELWTFAYAENGRALTPGIVVADLSADGVPEIVFATYTPDKGTGALYVVSAAGAQLHKVPLPERGSMSVPTIGDADGDGVLDIVVSLKDDTSKDAALVFKVPTAKPNCMLWPTGRANNLRNGWVR
jgi:uncharacterized membrane protein